MSTQLQIAVGLAAAGVGLALTFPDLRNGLRHEEASARFSAVAVGTYALWYGIALLAALGIVAWYVPIAAAVLPVGVLLGAPSVLDWDRHRARERLRHDYYQIIDAAKRTDLSRSEFLAVRRQIDQLSRYRRPATAEWIDLVQAEMNAWADGSPGPTDPATEQRILALSDRIFGAPLARIGSALDR